MRFVIPANAVSFSASLPRAKAALQRSSPGRFAFIGEPSCFRFAIRRKFPYQDAAMADRLPIYEIENDIVASLEATKRLVLQAPTGSGKSTQVPQMLLKHGLLGNGQVVILQPRRLATRLLASRVAHELGVDGQSTHRRQEQKGTQPLAAGRVEKRIRLHNAVRELS